MEKNQELTKGGYISEEEKVAKAIESYKALGEGEKGEFLGYVMLRLGITRDMWYSRMKGRTKWRKVEIDAITDIIQKRLWRNVQ